MNFVYMRGLVCFHNLNTRMRGNSRDILNVTENLIRTQTLKFHVRYFIL